MKRIILLTLISIFNLTLLFAQQSQERFTDINGQKASYMGVATTIEQAIGMLDSLKSLYRNDYSMEFYGSWRDLSSKDTILEIFRIEENGDRYKQGDYYMHLSNSLPFDTYRELIDSVMLGFDQGSYRNRRVPWELASSAINILYAPLIKKQVPNVRLGEYFELYREVSIHLMKFGSGSYFCNEPDFIAMNINDEVYNTIIDRLQNHPKYPERYKHEFFEKEAKKFNPLLYDSLDIPQRIKDLSLEDLESLRKWKTEDEEYLKRWHTILTVDAHAKAGGMSIEEYFYESQVGYSWHQFSMVGYYDISCVLSYVMKTNDQRLFEACREFLEKHPDYKVYDEGCREFFGLE